MRVMKHFVKALALGKKGKFDKVHGLPTVDSLRCFTRHFCNAWERYHEARIPPEIKHLMAYVSISLILYQVCRSFFKTSEKDLLI